MALGTNYARTASLKQVEAFDRKVVRHYIAKGATREEFLATVKEHAREKLGRFWDEELAKIQKKAKTP